MRILITGHLGFIGRAVCGEMSDHGWSVSGYDVGVDRALDVTQRMPFDATLHSVRPDVVLHLAAEVGKLNCERYPARALETNAGGTLNVAKLCSGHGVPLVYCSTSEVYGDYDGHEVYENFATRPSSGVYGLTKLWGEHVARLYAPEGLKIVRPTMPYGPGVPPGPGRRALDNLVWQALTCRPMVVHRGASRSWCWVDDVASGIRAVIERGASGTYNVGRDDEEVSMEDLAVMIAARAGLSPYQFNELIEVVDPPARQTAIKRLSCAKLRKLGWEPTTSLEDGLPLMVEWVKAWMGNGSRP